jgi:hypothetical protein
MQLQRFISVFDKANEKMLKEINIDYIPLKILRKIFTTKEDDPQLYDPYSIRKKEGLLLTQYLEPPIIFDFDQFIYQLDCFQIG